MRKQNDAMIVLEEVAVSLKDSAQMVDGQSEYDRGLLMGYYEAISTLLSQCAMAGIAADDIGLAGFKAESVLSQDKKAA